MRRNSTSNPTTRFSSRVDNYVRYRPTYPHGVLDLLHREVGLTPAWMIADIGSGTGIFTKLLLDNGNEVFALEPNREMRQAAEKILSACDKFHSISATAESTTLPDDSIDLVVAAQAFHWFDPHACRMEWLRILRPGGYAALVWNTRRTTGTPFLAAYEKLLLDYNTDYVKVRQENVVDEDLRAFFGGNYRKAALPNEQRLHFDGLKGRLLSASYTPGPDHPRHAPMLEALKALFEQHQRDGTVTIEYETEVFFRGMK